MTIFLCGFMGCGKTTVGEILAKKLGLPLIDTDAYIVEQEGKSIPDIFAQDGEPYFRKKEAEAIRTLCTQNAVISCGGGGNAEPGQRRLRPEKTAQWYCWTSPLTPAMDASRATPTARLSSAAPGMSCTAVRQALRHLPGARLSRDSRRRFAGRDGRTDHGGSKGINIT